MREWARERERERERGLLRLPAAATEARGSILGSGCWGSNANIYSTNDGDVFNRLAKPGLASLITNNSWAASVITWGLFSSSNKANNRISVVSWRFTVSETSQRFRRVTREFLIRSTMCTDKGWRVDGWEEREEEEEEEEETEVWTVCVRRVIRLVARSALASSEHTSLPHWESSLYVSSDQI